MSLIYCDIETIPAGDTIDPLSLKPPGNLKKAETIEAWYKDDAINIAAEKYRARALDSMNSEIIVIGHAIDDGPVDTISLEAGDEVDRLTEFQDMVKSCMGQYSEPVQYCGWNIKSFDIPFIWQRAVKYGLTALRKSINRDRYRGNTIDLMLDWQADFKDFRKLSDVGRYLRIAHNDEVSGEDVYDLYCACDMSSIISHCAADVELCRQIYGKIYG